MPYKDPEDKKAHDKEYHQRPDIKAKKIGWNRWGRILRKYGLTRDQYEWILVAQGGNCLLCGEPLEDDVHIDHCHKTGMIRGLLHSNCNSGIGMFNDNLALLRKATEYLETNHV